MIEIKYDTPIEVTEAQYKHLSNNFQGILAHRKDETTGKYYIKVWVMKYAPLVRDYLSVTNPEAKS